MVGAFGIFLMRQFIDALPNELLDAARIDGAGEFTIFARIVIPLCGPALATLTIFTFLARWDDFVWPLLVASDDAHRTLPVGLAAMQANNLGASGVPTAAAVLALLPTLVLFLALQRRFVEGITMTAGIR